jgi:4-alpha-glucanotransferase
MDVMRRAGILLPVFSLPSPHGIGTLGEAAYRFVDFLAAGGQSLWQVLPLGPTSAFDSPYQALSAFAGNPWFIDLESLREERLLTQQELNRYERDVATTAGRAKRVDYAGLRTFRLPLLFRAAARFVGGDGAEDADYRRFCAENHWWLQDFVAFMGDERHRVLQYFFFSQWKRLKRYANVRGIDIIGDLPLYVSEESCDFQNNRRLFCVAATGAKKGKPTESAGVPPDDFSAQGQVWNTPLYNWTVHKKTGYLWWLQRMAQAAVLYDHVRIDHFRGLSEYYAIPVGQPASAGRWETGPGTHFIDAVKKAAPGLGVIAEDLGILTEDVHALRHYSGWPGMKVLQFAFSPKEESDYLPHNQDRDCVVYTGTHDNNTLRGWATSEAQPVLNKACRYLGVPSASALPRAMIRAALASVAEMAILPMQDWLGLGASARINTPATVSRRNWSWRLSEHALTDALATEIFSLTALYGRTHN